MEHDSILEHVCVLGSAGDDDIGDITVTATGSAVEMFGGGNNDTYHIDTIEPNTPLLHLGEASDSGWHDDDNVTHNNTLTVTMSDHDANVALHQLLFTDYLKFPIDDRFEESDEILLYDSATDAAVDQVNTAGDGFTCLTLVTESLPPLADGLHNPKLELEDRAGNMSHDIPVGFAD